MSDLAPPAGSEGNPWRTLSSRPIYSNPWIKVREDQVIRPDGNPGIYGVVEMQSWAIGVVPSRIAASVKVINSPRFIVPALIL